MGIVDYISGQETLIGGQYADRATHILICDAGLDITNKDRVLYRRNVSHITLIILLTGTVKSYLNMWNRTRRREDEVPEQ